jgi:DDE superfamily endonuclease
MVLCCDIYRHVMNKTPTHFPYSSYIIGDKAYPSLMTCVVPFKQNGRLTRKQKSFNYYHAKARQVIERSFALLFGRWRRLKNLKMQCIEMTAFVVLAACVLHNICIDFDESNNDDVTVHRELLRRTAESCREKTYPTNFVSIIPHETRNRQV